MVAELIEREPLEESIRNYRYDPADFKGYSIGAAWAEGFNAGMERALHYTVHAPAVDTETVVHCKDCKKYVCSSHYCDRYRCFKDAYGYCDRGKRKDGDKNESCV